MLDDNAADVRGHAANGQRRNGPGLTVRRRKDASKHGVAAAAERLPIVERNERLPRIVRVVREFPGFQAR